MMRDFGLKAIFRVGVLILGLVGATLAQSQGDPNKYSTTPGNPSCRFFDGFADNGDGTVTDPRNGLVWKRCAEGSNYSKDSCVGEAVKMDWFKAMKLAKDTKFQGKSGWRLPSLEEISAIAGDDRFCDKNAKPKQNSISRIFPFDRSKNLTLKDGDTYITSVPHWTYSINSDIAMMSYKLDFMTGSISGMGNHYTDNRVILVQDKLNSESSKKFIKVYKEFAEPYLR